jgi:hypothetical protein
MREGNKIQVFVTIFMVLFILPAIVSAAGVLQFKSGFEDNVQVEGRTITGTDFSAPAGINNWDRLSDYLSWATFINGYFQGGSMEIAKDPKDPSNKVLHFHNTKPDGEISRSQWKMEQSGTGSNRFDKQFYRYRILVPPDIKNAVGSGSSPWYMIWESHHGPPDSGRHTIHLKKESNTGWYFWVRQRYPDPRTLVWENTGYWDVAVPFGEWFTLDVFFKYHETDGEFFVAITREGQARQTVANFVGQTQFGSKLHNQVVFKMYHDAKWFNMLPSGTHQYYDDFEIWSDFPPGYTECDCTSWQNSQCGGGTCPSDQMQQTRVCTPSGCNSESQCTADPICITIPDTTYNAIKTPTPLAIDGNTQEFANAREIAITNSRGTRGTYRLLWDETALYIAANVSDTQFNADQLARDGQLWNDDSLEVFFDTLNNKGPSRDQNDYKFFVNLWNVHTDTRQTDQSWSMTYNSEVSMTGSLNDNQDSDSDYIIEMAIPWSEWGIQKPGFGSRWGFDLSMNDRDQQSSIIQNQWANTDGGDANNPDGWGDLIFTHRADTSPDYGCIRQDELIPFIDLWKTPSTDVSMPELMEAIGLWKQGTGCNN